MGTGPSPTRLQLCSTPGYFFFQIFCLFHCETQKKKKINPKEKEKLLNLRRLVMGATKRLRLKVCTPPAVASLLVLSPGMCFFAQINPKNPTPPTPQDSPWQNLSFVPKVLWRCPLASPGDVPPAHLLLLYCLWGGGGCPPWAPLPLTGLSGAGDR